MTAPLIQPINITRGDDWGGTFTFDQAISGFSEIWFTVRAAYATTETNNTDAIFSATLTDGDIAVSGAYAATIDVGHDVTLTWTSPEYVYDVQIETLGGKLYTTQRGNLRMCPDVTR